MRIIKVDTDQSKSYFDIGSALVDMGFNQEDNISYDCCTHGYKNGYKYEKDDEFYRIIGFSHFNTTVYYVEIINEDDYEDYERNEELKELKKSLEGEILKIEELDYICDGLVGGESIFDYSISHSILDNCGSFAWGSGARQYDISFNVIEDNEEFGNLLVEVTDIVRI